MEEHRGVGRGSYIWGRSVHNTRIERLWYDVTNGFGRKWKTFFLDLEANHGLDPSRHGHIWLLHHLFLKSVNNDAQEWAQSWNSHRLQIRGERERSPRDMFFFGMLQEGPRGMGTVLAPEMETGVDELDINDYGVDWDVHDDPQLMAHLLEHNPDEWEENNPFASSSTPSNLSEVLCEPPGCPFTDVQLAYLDSILQNRVDVFSRNMNVRRLVWQEALEIARDIFLQSRQNAVHEEY
ncbi:hypothetical protein BJ138DRAFT_1014979 [Hygrophoropsis aurantiaca]|uniref:Uncharacterized protein n=1 Tax=Hygrophoropsis aurantiaca TaxID=72124 RepID=A0ACB8A0V9_9AGAM|nr:hypothetical protein BJ138DRAFT_1014979 [Hygrophoropsis aurantiaca]